MNINSNLCVICNQYLQEQLSLVTKGLTSLISSCDILGKTDLRQYLRSIRDESTLEPTPVYIHSSCRKTIYKRVKSVNNKSHNDVPKSPRPTLPCDSIVTFDFKTHCFIYSEKCGKDERHPDRTKEWCRAETLGSHDTILKLCSERLEKLPNDQQVVSIKRRILSCTDLVAAEGRYHKKCRGLLSLQTSFSCKKG